MFSKELLIMFSYGESIIRFHQNMVKQLNSNFFKKQNLISHIIVHSFGPFYVILQETHPQSLLIIPFFCTYTNQYLTPRWPLRNSYKGHLCNDNFNTQFLLVTYLISATLKIIIDFSHIYIRLEIVIQ